MKSRIRKPTTVPRSSTFPRDENTLNKYEIIEDKTAAFQRSVRKSRGGEIPSHSSPWIIIARKRSANSHVPGFPPSLSRISRSPAAGRDRRQRPVTNYILLAQSRPRVHLRPGPRPIGSEPPCPLLPSPSFFFSSHAAETEYIR